MHSLKINLIKYNSERNIRAKIVAKFCFLFISDFGKGDWLTNIP